MDVERRNAFVNVLRAVRKDQLDWTIASYKHCKVKTSLPKRDKWDIRLKVCQGGDEIEVRVQPGFCWEEYTETIEIEDFPEAFYRSIDTLIEEVIEYIKDEHINQLRGYQGQLRQHEMFQDAD